MTDERDGGLRDRGRASASHYRLYFMDRPDGHIGRLSEFEALTDELAILKSEDARGEYPMELWRDDRKIKRWESSRSLP